jgi:uncharacterized protein (TIGR00299 family) protein
VRLAYFDCFSGISGDMALGALVDAGADFALISAALAALPVGGFAVEREDVEVHDIAALRIHIESRPQDVIRTYGSIRAMLGEAKLPEPARIVAQRTYQRLAEASARIHNKEVDLVTFSEFGDLDCLVEIVGCAMALHSLGVERVYSSPIPTGLGMIRTEHGVTPIPSPVVLELLRGAPTYSRGIPVELVTPSGAAILAAVAEGFGDMPLMRSDRVGYGAGHLRLDFPNVLRVVVGEEQRAGAMAVPAEPEWARPNAFIVEATAKRLDKRATHEVLSDLTKAGALDVWMAEATGADSRARIRISAVGPADRTEALAAILRAAPGVATVTVSPVLAVPGS